MKRKVSLCIGIAIIVGWFIVSQFFLEQTLTQTKQLEEYVKTLEGKLSESDDTHFALLTKIRVLQQQIVQLEKDKKECKPCEGPTKGKEGLEGVGTQEGIQDCLRGHATNQATNESQATR